MRLAEGPRQHLVEPRRAGGDRFVGEKSLEVVGQLVGRRVPQLGRFLQTAKGDHLQVGVDARIEQPRGGGSCSSTCSTVSTGEAD